MPAFEGQVQLGVPVGIKNVGIRSGHHDQSLRSSSLPAKCGNMERSVTGGRRFGVMPPLN